MLKIVASYGVGMLYCFSATNPSESPDATAFSIAIRMVEWNFVVADDGVVKVGDVQTAVWSELQVHRSEPWIFAGKESALTRDISEVIAEETSKISALLNDSKAGRGMPRPYGMKLSFHSPCTLQHGMQINGVVEKILAAAGFELTVVQDSHLCCGSAGTYSILQPQLSKQLLQNKVAALESGDPARIVTANIGCLMHLQSGTSLPVRHWIEVLDEVLPNRI